MTNDHGKATEAYEEVTPEAADEQPQARSSEEPEVMLDEEAVAAIESEEAPADDADALGADAAAEQPAAEPEELAAKYLALAQRTQADFENYRKRASRDAAAAQTRGVVKLAKELLPAVDDLDRALAAAQAVADGAENPLVEGIKLVHADMVAALARVGIEGFSPKGERFDPQYHEAMAQQPVQGAEPGTIVEVYQRGYALGDTVIRPARVVVAG
ncbi:MAG TPA: nucleotide exchange factor GrpE [Solirubrobacteraceae bacterium]|jgi:molecular chaperone GrpE|nr:nucleotide exchange factor GrpE [Solirubrobacteraceae bacterium]